jgi:small-conductance mechanosensitive channel
MKIFHMKNNIYRVLAGILLTIIATTSTYSQAPGKIPGTFNFETDNVPVMVMNDTLFHLSQSIGTLTAHERVRRINERLNSLIRLRDVAIDSFYVYTSGDIHFISYKDHPIMAVFPVDTTGIGMLPEELAYDYLDDIKRAFSKNLPAYNMRILSRNVLNTGIIILLVIVVIFVISRIFRMILNYLESRKDRYLRGLHIRSYQLLDSSQQFSFIKNTLKILKLILILLVIFVALPMIFAKFPATEGITRKIISLVWNPVQKILIGTVNYIPQLITIIVIYIFFRLIIRGLRYLADEIGRENLVIPGFYPEWGKPTFMILRFILYTFMFVIIFPLLPGSDSDIFKGVSVFIGLLISFGSSSAIANAVAGIVITYMRPFKVGDRIKVDEFIGTVMEKSTLVTRIRTIKNEDVTIPNSKILTSSTINYSDPARSHGLIIHTTVTIGYDAPWRTVHRLLTEAALNTEGVMKDPAPFVLQTSLDDFYVSYQINVYIQDVLNMINIKSDLHQNIQDSFNRGGVEIMSPHYRSMRDGNEITIPKNP